jgi:hypothetical protein
VRLIFWYSCLQMEENRTVQLCGKALHLHSKKQIYRSWTHMSPTLWRLNKVAGHTSWKSRSNLKTNQISLENGQRMKFFT